MVDVFCLELACVPNGLRDVGGVRFFVRFILLIVIIVAGEYTATVLDNIGIEWVTGRRLTYLPTNLRAGLVTGQKAS